MAHLNIYKKRQVRRTVAYQVLMDDLIELGIVDKDEYLALTNIKRGELEDATSVAAIDDFGNPLNDGPDDEGPKNPDDEDPKNPDDEDPKNPDDEDPKNPDDEDSKNPDDEDSKNPDDE